MTESELDSLYGELCRAISEVGEAAATLSVADGDNSFSPASSTAIPMSP